MGYAHPTEMKDRPCPNGWTECAVCKHERACRAGLYRGENIIIKAAEIVERVVTAEAIESAEKIKGTWFEEFLKQPSEDIWAWMAKWKVPNLHEKEPWQAMSGPSAPGGGSKSNIKKSKKGNKPTQYVWGETL
jgi:hypothetical protein